MNCDGLRHKPPSKVNHQRRTESASHGADSTTEPVRRFRGCPRRRRLHTARCTRYRSTPHRHNAVLLTDNPCPACTIVLQLPGPPRCLRFRYFRATCCRHSRSRCRHSRSNRLRPSSSRLRRRGSGTRSQPHRRPREHKLHWLWLGIAHWFRRKRCLDGQSRSYSSAVGRRLRWAAWRPPGSPCSYRCKPRPDRTHRLGRDIAYLGL